MLYKISLAKLFSLHLQVILYNRDIITQRLNNVNINVLDEEGGKEEVCGGKEDATDQFVIDVVCKWPMIGRYVKVSVPTTPNSVFTLCEVEVMGVKGWYLFHSQG